MEYMTIIAPTLDNNKYNMIVKENFVRTFANKEQVR